jgi:hypothetical protein
MQIRSLELEWWNLGFWVGERRKIKEKKRAEVGVK